MIKILIVEDEVILAMELSKTLKDEGYEVVGTAANGALARTLFEQYQPDLILCDIHLRGSKNGIELVDELKAIRAVPVVYLTAYANTDIFERAKATNPSAYLVKPYQLPTLRSAIELAIFQFCTSANKELLLPTEKEPTDSQKTTVLYAQDCLFIKQQNTFVKVLVLDILYIVADGNYIVLYTHTSRHALRLPLTVFLEKINNPAIFRIHRTYAVNINKVDAFNDQEVMINGKLIPLSRQPRASFLKSVGIK